MASRILAPVSLMALTAIDGVPISLTTAWGSL